MLVSGVAWLKVEGLVRKWHKDTEMRESMACSEISELLGVALS